jgi:AcrR family transcriptional regulator
MGRKSLAAERQSQLVDAAIDCIVTYGIAGTTLAKIAEAAGVQTSVVSHYFGNKDAVIEASIDRSLANVRALIVERFVDVPPAKLLNAQLDVLFGLEISAPQIGPLIHEIIAASFFDEQIRKQVEGLYSSFTDILDASVLASYPKATRPRRAVVVNGILSLAHANAIFEWIAFDPDHFKRGRSAANLLLQSLQPSNTRKTSQLEAS